MFEQCFEKLRFHLVCFRAKEFRYPEDFKSQNPEARSAPWVRGDFRSYHEGAASSASIELCKCLASFARLLAVCVFLALAGCASKPAPTPATAVQNSEPPEFLSAYGLFQGN